MDLSRTNFLDYFIKKKRFIKRNILNYFIKKNSGFIKKTNSLTILLKKIYDILLKIILWIY